MTRNNTSTLEPFDLEIERTLRRLCNLVEEKLRNDITNFMQYDQKSMYEAWERYKDLLKKCLHHELPGWLQIQTFYNGLRLEHRAMVDATVGGSLMRRTPENAYGLLDDMALNAFS